MKRLIKRFFIWLGLMKPDSRLAPFSMDGCTFSNDPLPPATYIEHLDFGEGDSTGGGFVVGRQGRSNWLDPGQPSATVMGDGPVTTDPPP